MPTKHSAKSIATRDLRLTQCLCSVNASHGKLWSLSLRLLLIDSLLARMVMGIVTATDADAAPSSSVEPFTKAKARSRSRR